MGSRESEVFYQGGLSDGSASPLLSLPFLDVNVNVDVVRPQGIWVHSFLADNARPRLRVRVQLQ